MLGWHRGVIPLWINLVGSGGKKHLVVSLWVRQVCLQGMNLVVKSHWTCWVSALLQPWPGEVVGARWHLCLEYSMGV